MDTRFDRVLGTDKRGNPLVAFYKQVNGHYFYLELVLKGKRRLATKTFYRRKDKIPAKLEGVPGWPDAAQSAPQALTSKDPSPGKTDIGDDDGRLKSLRTSTEAVVARAGKAWKEWVQEGLIARSIAPISTGSKRVQSYATAFAGAEEAVRWRFGELDCMLKREFTSTERGYGSLHLLHVVSPHRVSDQIRPCAAENLMTGLVHRAMRPEHALTTDRLGVAPG